MRKISHKILTFVLSTSTFFLLLVGGYSSYHMMEMNRQQAAALKTTLTQEYDATIKYEVETALNVVNFYYDASQTGKMTEEEAKAMAIDALKALRYHGDGYFWIDDVDGTLIAHPIQPEDEGSNRLQVQDANGVYLIQEIMKAAKDGERDGYTDFMWVKPEETDTNNASPKRAYSELFNQWNWVISTGNYIDDINTDVAEKEAELQRDFQENLLAMTVFLLISLLANAIFSFWFSKALSRPIVLLAKGFEKDESGKISMKEIELHSKDEIGLLAKTLNEMSGQVREFIEGVRQESGHVEQVAKTVKADMGALNDEVEEISSATQEIVAGMEETTAVSEDTKNRALDVSAETDSFAQNAKDATGAVSEIRKRAQTLQGDLQEAVEKGAAFLTKAHEGLNQAKEDAKAVEQIGKLADTIIEITSQTNMLALNASIEASRAGEAGRGFAVIADEIRTLADNSQAAVGQIQTMIQSVTASVDALYLNSRHLVQYMAENVKKDYDLMMHASEDYAKDAGYLEQVFEEFHTRTERLNEIIQSMTTGMSEIAEATADGTNGAGNIASSIEIVTKKANELLEEANKSEQYSKTLLEMVLKFNL
ncbi:MAG: methyl-accepting chemotaxis protein [Lachnospiraceae bacterium]